MIVLDEQLMDPQIRADFADWYKGTVVTILTLRPRTQIDDDAIPTLLRSVRQPTFVTINYTDFWKLIAADKAYCIVCLKISGARSLDVSALVADLLKRKEFATKRRRMGKVISWRDGKVTYYE